MRKGFSEEGVAAFDAVWLMQVSEGCHNGHYDLYHHIFDLWYDIAGALLPGMGSAAQGFPRRDG